MTHIAKKIFLIGLAVIFLIGLDLRLEALDVVIFNEWVARDFDRAFNMVDGIYFPLAGPEVNNGGRLPGPFMYLFLTLPLFIKYSYNALFEFNFLLNIASIIGLFIVLKRYFDVYVAGITAGLVSISFLSIVAVSFPINPSFLFPFITIFIWLLLEFALKGNVKVVPYIALTFALAVQFHYSIATYFLIPVVIGGLFRIKVPLRTILISLVIIAICVSPYSIHKSKFFTPYNAGEKMTLAHQDFSSPWVNFKVLTLLHTFNYLSEIKTYPLGEPQLPKAFSLIMSLLTGIAFYLLFYIVIKKYKIRDWRSCKKETIVLVIFWVPALLYGVVNPMTYHLWYGFIFIIPQALLLALLVTTVHRHIVHNPCKVLYVLVVLILFVSATLSMNRHARVVFAGINENLFGKQIVNGTYKNTQRMLSVLSSELDLRPDEFYERVYISGYHLLSKRRLKMLNADLVGSYKSQWDKSGLSCYYIWDETKPYSGSKNRQGRLINLFLNDKSIDIISSKSLSLSQWGFSEVLKIYQYQPVQNQSCYNNTFNPFVTTKSIRNLLIAAKDIPVSDGDVSHKVVDEQIEYDSNDDLKLLTAGYAINNKISQSPFQFNLDIVKIENGYSIKGEMELYSFFRAPNYDIKKMDIVIETMPVEKQAKGLPFKERGQNVEVREINILTPQTSANFLNVNSTHRFSYNQKWYREVPTAINLKKGEFNIYLKWILNCGEYPLSPPCPLRPEKEFILPIYNKYQKLDSHS